MKNSNKTNVKKEVNFNMNGEKLAKELIPNFKNENYKRVYPYGRKSYTVKESSNCKTVLIEISYYKFKKTLTLEYPIVTLEEIKSSLHNNEPINLDYCYIKDFNYLKLCNDNECKLSAFSAKCSFFDGVVNFSKAIFEDGDVSFESCSFGDDPVDFSNITFGKGLKDFSNMEFNNKYVLFLRTRFGIGDVNFSNVDFGNSNVRFDSAEFNDGEVLFNNTKFKNGDVDFSNSVFGKGKISFFKASFSKNKLTFENTNFGDGNVSFSSAKFNCQLVNYSNTKFKNGRINFIGANYCNSDIDFSKSKFENCEIDFFNNEINGNSVDFSLSKFNVTSVHFMNIRFLNTNVILNSVIARESDFSFIDCLLSQYLDFRFSEIETLKIINCSVEKELLLDSTNHSNVTIHNLSLKSTKNRGQIYIDWKTAQKSIKNFEIEPIDNTKKAKLKAKNKLNDSKAKEMRMIKENYHNIGEYDNEDNAFVEYMRYKRKSSSNPFVKIPHLIIDVIGKYATSPLRVFFSMIIVVILFGFLFSGFVSYTEINVADNLITELNIFTQGVYFSLITFLTIGYGDVSPLNSLTAFAAGIEGFLGLFLMSYFTVAVVRKTLR